MRLFKLPILFFVISMLLHVNVHAQQNSERPRLVRLQGNTRLFIGKNPFLILGGELGNSSASSVDYMRPLWPALKSMHLNTGNLWNRLKENLTSH